MNSISKHIRIGLVLAGLLLVSLMAWPLMRVNFGRAASVTHAELNLPVETVIDVETRKAKEREDASESASKASREIKASGQKKNPPIIVTCPDFLIRGVCSVPPDFDPPFKAPTTWWKTTITDVISNGHKQQQVQCWYGGADAPAVITRTLPQGYKCEDVNAKDTVCKNVGIKIGK